MGIKKAVVTSAVAGIAVLGLFAQPAAAAVALPDGGGSTRVAEADDVEVQEVQRESFPCKDGTNNTLNLSWDPFDYSTTIYFNNHCSKKMEFMPHDQTNGQKQCITVNANTKGKKKVYFYAGTVWDNCWS
ncbi:MAG: hypothetical protein ACRDXX_00995 [Stackebrandtia sp.]